MVESLALAVTFTALFVATGVFHLRRCAAVWSVDPVSGDHRLVELAHLMMSLAMVGMVWAWGGPTARWVQIVLFGLFTVIFLARAAAAGAGRAGWGWQALSVGAMAWMVAAMPLLGHSVGAGGSGHHGTPAGAPTSLPTPADEIPLWAVTATVVLAAALVVTAFGWVVAAVRRSAVAPVPAPVADPPKGRAASWAHALMSIGMAGMLLVMV